MRRDDGTFDNVEIANLEARMFALLAADSQQHEDPPSAAHEQLMAWRDHRIMTGRAQALGAMSHVVRAAARGDTGEARERLDKTLVWFERGGGQYDRDLTDAIDRTWDTIGNPILVGADAAADDGTPARAEPDRCSTCDGDGSVHSPAWRDWHARERAARKAWKAENPDPYDFWDQSDEAAALYFDQPDCAERIECDDCNGTGVTDQVDAMESMSLALRAALEGDHDGAADHFARARHANPDTGRAVEDDILALLDRTPRHDSPQPDVTDAGPAADTAKPARYVFVSGAPAEDCPTCGGDAVIGTPAHQAWHDRVQAELATWRADHNGDEERWWATDESAALYADAPADVETKCLDCHGSGLVGVELTEDGSLVDADGEPVSVVLTVERRQEPTGVDAADTEPGPPPGPATDPDTTDTPDPKVAGREQGREPIDHAGEANDASPETADVDQVGDVDPNPVERAQRAVLELKGRRALEEQYARDREADDASLDRAFSKAAADVDAWGRPGPVLSAFDD